MLRASLNRNNIILLVLIFFVAVTLPLKLISVITTDQMAAVIAVILLLIAWLDPQWGLIFTISSLAVLEILPDIPFATSFTALLGGVSFLAFLVQVMVTKKIARPKKLEKGFRIGILLIAWIVISNPNAALFLGDRVWVATLVQLWLIAWLARYLLNNSESTKLLMVMFVAANLASALIVFLQGRVGETVYTSKRGYGLALGSNGTARYLIIALLAAYYLYMTNPAKKIIRQFAYAVSAVILGLGVVYTVSRSGLVLIFVAAGLILLAPSTKGKAKKWAFIVFAGAAFFYFVPTNLINLLATIVPSISTGSDTAGLRYKLWQSGIRMFMSSPISGIGIGQFQFQLPFFGSDILPRHFINLTAHSMYIQLLSETGLVGICLFVLLAVVASFNLLRGMRSQDYQEAMTAWIWFGTLMIILAGAVTKTDFSEKLLWVAMGIGFAEIKGQKEPT